MAFKKAADRKPSEPPKTVKRLRSFKHTHVQEATTPSRSANATPKNCPNYMKSTRSFDARAVKLVKMNSLKVRKASSLRIVGVSHDKVQKNTCASTLKDVSFPATLPLTRGATEGQGPSLFRVCPYNYCSLNGHHHKEVVPLRYFIKERRLQMRSKVSREEGWFGDLVHVENSIDALSASDGRFESVSVSYEGDELNEPPEKSNAFYSVGEEERSLDLEVRYENSTSDNDSEARDEGIFGKGVLDNEFEEMDQTTGCDAEVIDTEIENGLIGEERDDFAKIDYVENDDGISIRDFEEEGSEKEFECGRSKKLMNDTSDLEEDSKEGLVGEERDEFAKIDYEENDDGRSIRDFEEEGSEIESEYGKSKKVMNDSKEGLVGEERDDFAKIDYVENDDGRSIRDYEEAGFGRSRKLMNDTSDFEEDSKEGLVREERDDFAKIDYVENDEGRSIRGFEEEGCGRSKKLTNDTSDFEEDRKQEYESGRYNEFAENSTSNALEEGSEEDDEGYGSGRSNEFEETLANIASENVYEEDNRQGFGSGRSNESEESLGNIGLEYVFQDCETGERSRSQTREEIDQIPGIGAVESDDSEGSSVNEYVGDERREVVNQVPENEARESDALYRSDEEEDEGLHRGIEFVKEETKPESRPSCFEEQRHHNCKGTQKKNNDKNKYKRRTWDLEATESNYFGWGIGRGMPQDTIEETDYSQREPNFLPAVPDPEGEKVDLRHQEMDDRRNADEWMIDHALQLTVSKLASVKTKKVELMVEAFERVRPVEGAAGHSISTM